MAIVTGDRYLESLVKFVENHAEPLIEGQLVLKLNPVGLRYVQSRLEALEELESLLAGAPVDYLRAYVSDLGDHRAIEQLRRILRLLPSLKVVSVLPPLTGRDPTPLYLLPFGRLKVLELRGCDLSTSAAKGLLDLRFTLEKFICHDSTDALRHVFASRIVEIKDSPKWNRLSFVSCACNGFVLMDESLQLLPVVETLDLSRNKFAKANNLRMCTKLKHLDLGFNSLRSIASFSEVSSRVVKLVLRNNAITTLRGIENMKSLEGLDVSYNIISSFSEVGILAGLPSLQDLWLEGNPLCYARWFRPQVFSLFSHPEKLKLDEKRISASEFWQRQIIVASRQKQPASFGFYSPLKDDADLKGSKYTKRKRISRLVSIDSEEPTTFIYSDQDSGSFDINENQSKDENGAAEDVAELEDMIKRIEFMKKERSDLWLEEFKEWMNHASDNVVDGSKFRSYIYNKKINWNCEAPDENLGETSRYISGSIQLSGDESSTVILESETSFADASTVVSTQHYLDRIGEASSRFRMGHAAADTSTAKGLKTTQEGCGSSRNEWSVADAGDACVNSLAVSNQVNVSAKSVIPSPAAINDIIGSSSSSTCPRSPPHYQNDILHRRQNLEEEFLQLSAESISVASSDSITSCSEDDSEEFGPSIAQIDQYVNENLSVMSEINFHYQEGAGDAYHDRILLLKQNGGRPLGPAVRNFIDMDVREVNMSTDVYCDSFPYAVRDDEIASFRDEETDCLEKKKHRKKPKRRMVSLPEEDAAPGETDSSKKSSDYVEISRSDVKGEGNDICPTYCLLESTPAENHEDSTRLTVLGNCHSGSCSRISKSNDEKDDFVESFFNSNIADSGVNEVSKLYMHCDCLFLEKSGSKEREVAVLRSSEHKLYILLIVRARAGSSLEIVGCHRADDVKDVFVGLGLLCLRVYFEGNTTYLFITRCLEKSRELLCVLDLFDSSGVKDCCSLTSLERIQINLFEEHVCGGCKNNIFQYSMVLYWHSNLQEDMWLSRSLFLLECHLLVCAEDLMQFGTYGISLPTFYFSPDSYSAVGDISELVIDTLDGLCVSLTFECTSECLPWEEGEKVERRSAFKNRNRIGDQLTWKLKWYSKESLLNFVALLKAIYHQSTSSSLPVRFIS